MVGLNRAQRSRPCGTVSVASTLGDKITCPVVLGLHSLVGAVMAVVVRVGDGELEISYPGGQREIIHD